MKTNAKSLSGCSGVPIQEDQVDRNLNTLRQRQKDHHFADNIFKFIFTNEKFCILIKISLKFLPEGPVDNESS